MEKKSCENAARGQDDETQVRVSEVFAVQMQKSCVQMYRESGLWLENVQTTKRTVAVADLWFNIYFFVQFSLQDS